VLVWVLVGIFSIRFSMPRAMAQARTLRTKGLVGAKKRRKERSL
jgi:hypothetical protein